MTVHDLRDVGSGALHRGQRIVDIRGRRERIQRAQLIPGEGLVESLRGDGERVLHVQVSHVGSVAVGDDEARVTAAGHGVLQLCGGAAEGQGDELVTGHHDVGDFLLGELEGALDHAGVILHGTFSGRGGHDGLQLAQGEGRGNLVLSFDLHEVQQAVGEVIEQSHDGCEDLGDTHQRRHNPESQASGGEGDGCVLGHHFAEDDVQVGHQDEGDAEGQHVDDRGRQANQVHGHLQQVV